MNREQIDRAKRINLAEYLLLEGEPLVKEGAYYRHRDHDSLKFRGNLYYWNSRDDKGDAIRYLQEYQNMTFRQAVIALLGANLTGEGIETKFDQPFSVENIKLSANMRQVFAYLNKTRSIDNRTIKQLIDERLLFQEAETNNAVFQIRDENDHIVGAELAGTLSGKRFKGIKTGSKYGYGFNIRCGENPRYILFFESAIDLLSFMETDQNTIAKMKGSRLVSLAGLKEPIFKHSLQAFGATLQPVLCVDNDNAGNEFIARLKAEFDGLRVYQPPPPAKDWNDLLKYRKGTNDK